MAVASGSSLTKQKSKSSLGSCGKWEMLSPAGPTLAHHTGCIVNNVLYIHGGIDKKFSKEPLDKLYKFELDGAKIWQEVRAPNSPALSHHACAVLHNRYMLLIGGWNGHQRTTQAFAYDTQDDCWIIPTVSGFPEGGGLSSHIAVVLSSGEVLVCGRDGSTRTHRRHGDAYYLTGDINKKAFTYLAHALEVDSRSGHTAHVLSSKLYLFGGRSDKLIEIHSGIKGDSLSCGLVTRLAALSQSAKPLSKTPCGRKQHISAAGSGAVFIHGGETFDGRSRDPVGEMYLVTLKPTIQWYGLGDSGIGRAGHMCAASENKLVIHGGEGAKGLIHSDSHQLLVP